MLVNRWVGPRTTVLDPFCGSGTTLVEARLLGRPSIDVDLNPLAVAVSRAKLQTVHLQDLSDRLTSLAGEFRGESEIEDIPDTLFPIFHRRTLARLCYLRKALNDHMAEDVFIRSCILGIMHGKHRRDGTTAYLSVDMPNTFSMSPEYVRRFVERNGLLQPPVDVFSKLRERAVWILRSGALSEAPSSVVLHGDAGSLDQLLEGDPTVKTTRVWGEERKGRATSKDRVIVLRRVAGRRRATLSQRSRDAPQQRVAADARVAVRLAIEKVVD